MKKIKLLTALIIVSLSKAAAAAINPSLAMPEALKLGQYQIIAHLTEGNYSISEAHVGRGKYAENSFGDYSVELALISSSAPSKICQILLRTEKILVEEQPVKAIVLEQLKSDLQHYQIVAKIHHARCSLGFL